MSAPLIHPAAAAAAWDVVSARGMVALTQARLSKRACERQVQTYQIEGGEFWRRGGGGAEADGCGGGSVEETEARNVCQMSQQVRVAPQRVPRAAHRQRVCHTLPRCHACVSGHVHLCWYACKCVCM